MVLGEFVMDKSIKIYVAGHRGMVGAAIWRALEKEGYSNLHGRSSSELDLRNQIEVENFFTKLQPDVVIDAAARVGGILANNSYPYSFLMDNLLIQNNLIEASRKQDVKRFIFLGSSCIYPKLSPQPLKEEYLLTDSLEPTNEWYAIAKIAGVKACEAARKQYGLNYISLMPTNLYGSHDNFDLETSHVLPAMIRKFHDAKENGTSSVILWGTGEPMREFLYVDDLAAAVIFSMENEISESLYNVGTGVDITIKELATTIKSIVGFEGEIIWDTSKPNGTPRKLMDISKMHQLGWKHKIDLSEGIKMTYDWFLANQSEIKEVKIK